jgi:hypothetical protein
MKFDQRILLCRCRLACLAKQRGEMRPLPLRKLLWAVQPLRFFLTPYRVREQLSGLSAGAQLCALHELVELADSYGLDR